MRLLTLPGVFRPRSDGWLLVDALRESALAPGRSVLDLFTGSGVIAIAAAAEGAAAVTAVDASRRAVLCAWANARLNAVRVEVRRGDMFGPVAGERFDLITANPPYVPATDGGLPSHGAARAWEGGRDGRAFLDRFCRLAPDHLTPGGTIILVQSALADGDRTLEQLRAMGLEVEIAAAQRGPLGPLVAARAAELERRGILAPGQREEEVLVIAATDVS